MVTDDIVTRLQEAERLIRNGEMDRDDIGDIIDWCADEIERLRALADELHQRGMLQRKATDKLGEALEQCEADCDRWRKIADDLFDYFVYNTGQSTAVQEYLRTRHD